MEHNENIKFITKRTTRYANAHHRLQQITQIEITADTAEKVQVHHSAVIHTVIKNALTQKAAAFMDLDHLYLNRFMLM